MDPKQQSVDFAVFGGRALANAAELPSQRPLEARYLSTESVHSFTASICFMRCLPYNISNHSRQQFLSLLLAQCVFTHALLVNYSKLEQRWAQAITSHSITHAGTRSSSQGTLQVCLQLHAVRLGLLCSLILDFDRGNDIC